MATGGAFRDAVVLMVVATACNWTTVGFDASRSGFNSLDKAITPANVGTLTQRWKAALATGAGSAPVVAGGKVFVTSDSTASVTSSALQAYDAAARRDAPVRRPRRVVPSGPCRLHRAPPRAGGRTWLRRR